MNETAFKFADFYTCVLEKIRECAISIFFFLGIPGDSFNSLFLCQNMKKGREGGKRIGCCIEVDFFCFLRTRSIKRFSFASV